MVAEGEQIEGGFDQSEIELVYQFPGSDDYLLYKNSGGDMLSSAFDQYDADGYYVGTMVVIGRLDSLRYVSLRPGFLKQKKKPASLGRSAFRKWVEKVVGF